MSAAQSSPEAIHAEPLPLWLPAWVQAEQVLFWLTIVAAAGMMWLAPRLPMVDLPQHVAQVTLWHDLITGQSAFADIVRINLMTPYLLGYGLMLPLSFVFPAHVIAQIVLTLALLAFVAACQAIRRELGGDRRLDWLFLLSFYGYCWKLGFMTFLVASPLALLFLLLALRHARQPGWVQGTGLAATGLVLLFSHGLMFVGAAFLGGLLMLDQAWQERFGRAIRHFAPYVAIGFCAIALRLATQEQTAAVQAAEFAYGLPIWQRPAIWLISIADMDNAGTPLLPLATLAALCVPFLPGCGPFARRGLVLLTGLIALLCLLPTDAVQTGMIYQRFALFLPPFLAFACAERKPQLAHTAVMALACWLVLGIQASRITEFARESQPFETVLNAAEPGKRALAVIFEAQSPAASSSHGYLHYAAWYQAEKHGFVDFNFAAFHPQIVRFRPGKIARAGETFAYAPQRFSFAEVEPDLYDYVFVRGSGSEADNFRAASPCALVVLAADGPWHLMKRGTCAGQPAPAAGG